MIQESLETFAQDARCLDIADLRLRHGCVASAGHGSDEQDVSVTVALDDGLLPQGFPPQERCIELG